jgi:hypothetical protein
MPIKRATTVSGQPSPERQSVLSFVSPSVADLLFYETVDAKTVGAGSGKVIDSATWADTDLNADQVKVGAVEGGVHSDGYTVTVNTATSHGFVSGNIVTVVGLSDLNWSVDGAHKVSVTDSDTFTFFVRQEPKTLSGTFSPLSTARVYKNHPSYGAAHPDADAFPRHKLCHVKQADTEGLFFEYYYAADRLHQDDYNFEFSQADLGGNQYDTVVRTYVLLRSEFSDTDAKYEAGDRMPDVPASQFEDDYILMTRQQKRVGDSELDGLFVIEQRVYFKDEDKVSFSTHPQFKEELSTTEILAHVGKAGVPTKVGNVAWGIDAADDAANWGITTDGTFNYEVQQLSNDWWRIVKQQLVGSNRLTAPTGNLLARRPYARAKEEIHSHVSPVVGDVLFYVTVDRPDGDIPAHPAYGALYLEEPYAAHKLCFIKQVDEEGLYFNYYYAADRDDQDTYNFEFSQADLGGNKYDTVIRTYVTPRAGFNEDNEPFKAGDAMPSLAGGFGDDYILMTRQQKRIGDQELDSLYVVEQRIYFKRVAISTSSYDEATKGVLVQTETLYYRGEAYNAAGNIEVEILDETKWGVSLLGVQTEAKQLSEDWFLVTSTDVIPQDKDVAGSFGGKVLQSYETYITYSWPAVLGDDGTTDYRGALISTGGINIMKWEDKGGTFRTYVRPMFKEQGYRGPTRATIVEEWAKKAPTISNDTQRPFVMRPLPVVYNSPYLTVQIPPTLHGAMSLICDTGTSDPTWGHNVGSAINYPPTNVTDWPDHFVATVEVNPFRGGYLTRQVTVFKPEPINAKPPVVPDIGLHDLP